MTLMMPDSTTVADLPSGYPAYLGYADGDWPTAGELQARFPGANLVILTVTGQSAGHGARVASGADAEPGDLTAAAAVQWAAGRAGRPVIYASVQGAPGYGMHDVLAELAAQRIPRERARLLSAHYGGGPHICGPASCGLISVPMDGTQWTNHYPTAAGPYVDMSLLEPGFFGPALTETEKLVQELGTVRQGDTGETVKTAQGLLLARGYAIGVSGVLTAGIDGVFGPLTASAVKRAQEKAGIAADGIVGPQTWPVLLGVA